MIRDLAAARPAGPRRPLPPQLRQGGGPAGRVPTPPAATGVLTLDADLQDDPAEIPSFLERLDDGFDVVSGWKKVRHDPWHKVFPSRVFNGMVSWPDRRAAARPQLRVEGYRAEVVREVRLYGELHRFVPVLAAARGSASARS